MRLTKIGWASLVVGLVACAEAAPGRDGGAAEDGGGDAAADAHTYGLRLAAGADTPAASRASAVEAVDEGFIGLPADAGAYVDEDCAPPEEPQVYVRAYGDPEDEHQSAFAGLPAISRDGELVAWAASNPEYGWGTLAIGRRDGTIVHRIHITVAGAKRANRILEEREFVSLTPLPLAGDAAFDRADEDAAMGTLHVRAMTKRGGRTRIQVRDGERVLGGLSLRGAMDDDDELRAQQVYAAWIGPNDDFAIVSAGACGCWCWLDEHSELIPLKRAGSKR